MAGRLLWQNYAHLSAAVPSVSSEDLSFPKRWITDPLRSMRSRTKVGWTVLLSENDRLDFNEASAGDKVATLVPGYYATGTLYAVALQTAMNAVAVDNTYTCTYDAVTHKLTILRNTGSQNFSLEWSTGANPGRSIGRDAGFILTSDDGPGTTFTSDYAVYGSRQWWKIDLGSALSIDAVMLAGIQTLTANGLVRIQANASDVWTSPSYNQSFDSTYQVEDLGIHWPATPQVFRWWRIVLDDPYNPNGFYELAVPYLGTYFTLNDVQKGFTNNPSSLSELQVGDAGALFHDNKGTSDMLEVLARLITRAERNALVQIYKVIGSKALFFVLNDANLLDVRYMSLVTVPQFTHITSEDRYDVTLQVREQIQ